MAKRLVPRVSGLYGSGDPTEFVTEADAMKLEAVVEAASLLSAYAACLCFDEPTPRDGCECSACIAHREFDQALAALWEG